MELSPHIFPGNPNGNPQNFQRVPEGTERKVADREVEMDRLFGRPDATGASVRKWEQPWHRNAAYMFASGKYSAKQVALACEKSYNCVIQLFKNKWFQTTVLEIQKENGAGDIMELFRAECHNSLVTLIEIRDDPKAPQSVRRASAIDILHQVLGKPTQRVEMDATPRSDDPVAEVARLEQENARLKDTSPASSSDLT